MRLQMYKEGDGLFPYSRRDYDKYEKVNDGDLVSVKILKPRNPRFHRKYFALLNLILKNQDRYNSIEELLDEVKLAIGHYKTHYRVDGQRIKIPKSISFEKMDDLEFEEIYEKTLYVLSEFINTDKEIIRRELKHFW